jgi:Ribbon-helix-helix protein, copG family
VRTTLTLDEDVARRLEQEARRSGRSFKEVVNHFLRLGLSAARKSARKPFVVTPINLGLPEGYDFDNVERVIELLEGPLHR